MRKTRLANLLPNKFIDDLSKQKHILYILLPISLIGSIYLMGKYADRKVRTVHKPVSVSFSGGKVLEGTGRNIYKRKEKVFHKRIESVDRRVDSLNQKLDNMKVYLESMKGNLENREGRDRSYLSKSKKR